MDTQVAGCIPYIEYTRHHRDFLLEAKPEYALLKIQHARRLVDNDITADDLGGDNTAIITTTTIYDVILDRISWADERDIIRSFQPEYHIPTDVSVYNSQPINNRIEGIKNCMLGAKFIQAETEDIDTSIIPMFKGFTPKERKICLTAADALNAGTVAIYLTEYFTTTSGNSDSRALGYLNICNNHDMPNALVIGMLSPDTLAKAPDFVTAGAGQYQWRKRYDPENQTTKEVRSEFENLEQKVNDALGVKQPENKGIQSKKEEVRSD
jgi:hypothetical protein